MKEYKHLEVIMKKMFSYVNEEFSWDYVKEPNWFIKHEINQEDEDNFIKWFENYLLNNKEARIELMFYPSKNKRDIKNTINLFLFNYGWKRK